MASMDLRKLLTDDLMRNVCSWIEGYYKPEDIKAILAVDWPLELRQVPSKLYRGEGCSYSDLKGLQDGGFIEAFGLSWTESLKIAQNFAWDNDHDAKVVFEISGNPADVAINLKLLGESPEFLARIEEIPTDCDPKEGVRAVHEEEILFKQNVKLYLKDMLLIAEPGWPPKWKKLLEKATSKLATAGLSPILYHVTYLNRLADILGDNQFQLTAAPGTKSDEGKKLYFLSCSRVKTGGYAKGKGSQTCNIVLDGVALGQRYAGSPVDYWGPEFARVENHPGKIDREKYDEQEDRVWADERYIKPATKYIKEIHCLLQPKDAKSHGDTWKEWLRKSLIVAKKEDIPFYLYHDEKAFSLQNKKEAVGLEEFDLKREPQEKTYYYGERGDTDLEAHIELYRRPLGQKLSKRASDIKNYLYNKPDRVASLQAAIHNARSQKSSALEKLLKIFKEEGIGSVEEFIGLLQAKYYPAEEK